jgi:nucleoside-diphosphate-sugar epimerase
MKPLSSNDLEHVFSQTSPLWETLRGRRLFLTGGTGFFGIWLLETLAYCNQKLGLDISASVLTRNPEAFGRRMTHVIPNPSIRLVRGDIRDFVFPDHEVDYVVHGAAPTTMHESIGALELMKTIVHGTERMIELATTRNARSFLFISSGAVYGRQPEHMTHVREDYLLGPDWVDPSSVYGEGKRVSEQMCSIVAKETGLRTAIARCFTFVGPHLPLDKHFAIGNFIADAMGGRNIALKGSGTPTRSYLYMADLAVWLWTLLLSERKIDANPLVVNVGSGEPISIRDLAKTVIQVLNPRLEVQFSGSSSGPEQRPHYVPDVSKAEAVLGLRSMIDLPEAIRRTAEWYL